MQSGRTCPVDCARHWQRTVTTWLSSVPSLFATLTVIDIIILVHKYAMSTTSSFHSRQWISCRGGFLWAHLSNSISPDLCNILGKCSLAYGMLLLSSFYYVSAQHFICYFVHSMFTSVDLCVVIYAGMTGLSGQQKQQDCWRTSCCLTAVTNYVVLLCYATNVVYSVSSHGKTSV